MYLYSSSRNELEVRYELWPTGKRVVSSYIITKSPISQETCPFYRVTVALWVIEKPSLIWPICVRGGARYALWGDISRSVSEPSQSRLEKGAKKHLDRGVPTQPRQPTL